MKPAPHAAAVMCKSLLTNLDLTTLETEDIPRSRALAGKLKP